MDTLSYPYRPKPWAMVLASLFFGAIAVFMANQAMVNTRGLIINGIIHLGPQGATIFKWCIAGIAAAFVAVGIAVAIVGLVSKRQLTLSSTEISVPRFWFSRPATVLRLADIQQMATQVIQKQTFLHLIHAQGKTSITAAYLPTHAAFDELCDEIARRRSLLQ